MKAKILYFYLICRIWLYKQWLLIAPYIGEVIYWVLCAICDHWRVWLALIVGAILGVSCEKI
jgi:hypothetical protein